jgi:hypothetical protein
MMAEASRQGARQAAANSRDNSPFSATVNGSCQGTLTTDLVMNTTTGCLSDNGIQQTVAAVLTQIIPASAITLKSSTSANGCISPAPPVDQAYICITQPASAAQPASPANCSAVWATANYPLSGLGGRQEESQSRKYVGCYLIQVTVAYTFRPWTPVVQNLTGGNIVLVQTTSTVAEF